MKKTWKKEMFLIFLRVTNSDIIIREDFLESLNFGAFQEIISNNNSILITAQIRQTPRAKL